MSMKDVVKFPLNVLDTRSAYLDVNGKILANGRLAIYTDNTSTELAKVYSDINLQHEVENPAKLQPDARTGTGLYTGHPVFVSVERLFGTNNDGSKIYVQIYGYETHSGLEIDALFNSNYVKNRLELREVKNRNPTWVIEEGNPHLYVLKEGDPLSYDGIINVESFEFSGYYWYWETKEIHADQAGISNKGNAHNITLWRILSTLSKYDKYKIIIPKGTYNFGGQQMPDLSFTDLEIHSGVTFISLISLWVVSIINNVECFSDVPIQWYQLPKGKIYDRKFFKTIYGGDLPTLNEISSDDSIHLRSGATETKNLTSKDITCENILVKGNGSFKKDINADGNINAKGDIIAEGNLSANGEIIADAVTLKEDIKVRKITIAGHIFANMALEGSYFRFHELTIRPEISTFSLVNTEANPRALSIRSDSEYLESIDKYFPIGSYMTGFIDDYMANNIKEINTVFYIKNRNGGYIECTDNQNLSPSVLRYTRFANCGLIGNHPSGSGNLYLIRRIS